MLTGSDGQEEVSVMPREDIRVSGVRAESRRSMTYHISEVFREPHLEVYVKARCHALCSSHQEGGMDLMSSLDVEPAYISVYRSKRDLDPGRSTTSQRC